MLKLLPALIRDLISRCAAMEQRFENTRSRCVDVRAHAERGCEATRQLREEAESLREELDRLLAEPDLGDLSLLRTYVRTYREIVRQVTRYERFLLCFVERYSDADRRLTALCKAVTAEVGWPLPPPLVGAFSHEYYWTAPDLGVVGAPITEADSLLGLPDLCHELGHNLARVHHAALTGTFVEDLTRHLAVAEETLRDAEPRIKAQLTKLREIWTDHWVHEFVADIAATYIIGPCYGLQHIRFCTGYEPRKPDLDILYTNITHPDEEARLRVVSTTLDQLGQRENGDDLNQLWDSYARTTNRKRLGGYAVCYPESVLFPLVKSTIAGCRQLGIRSFDHDGHEDAVRRRVASAWWRFRHEPEEYFRCEAAEFADLVSKLGEAVEAASSGLDPEPRP